MRVMPRIIWVQCLDPVEHPFKEVRLEVFERADDGKWRSWPQPAKSKGPFRPGQARQRNSMQLIDAAGNPIGDALLYPEDGPPPDELAARRRFQIQCPICGRNVVARAETLEPILDTIADNTPEDTVVPLRWLAAKLASKQ